MKAVTLSIWTGSLPLFLLVSSSSQDRSGTDEAEARAVMEQGDRRCMCAFARKTPGRGRTDDRNTVGDGLAGPSVGLGPRRSWKTLVWGAPCWRLPHQPGAICISDWGVRSPHLKSSHGFHCHPTSKPKQWPSAESCGWQWLQTLRSEEGEKSCGADRSCLVSPPCRSSSQTEIRASPCCLLQRAILSRGDQHEAEQGKTHSLHPAGALKK